MDGDLRAVIQRSGAGRVGDALVRYALRSIRVNSQLAAGHVAGASRLGGLPDLPSGVNWPRMEVIETPLAFLAQINLSETAPYDGAGLLPKSGMLYFFADPEEYYGFEPADRDRWQVIYSETVPADGPTPAPGDLSKDGIFKESRLTFASEWTLPPYESPMVEELNLTGKEAEAYLEAGGEGIIHRLLGHPQQVQGFVPYEVAMAASGATGGWDTPEAEAARSDYDQWVLLLQIDSDWETNEIMWGDVGRLYFYIRKDDLAQRRFDQAWLMMQCC